MVPRASPPSVLAAKAGPGAETGTGLDNQQIRSGFRGQPHPAADGGGGMAAGARRDYHEPIHTRLPFVHAHMPRAHPAALFALPSLRKRKKDSDSQVSHFYIKSLYLAAGLDCRPVRLEWSHAVTDQCSGAQDQSTRKLTTDR
jgi:hypothetical protein